jgi:hypothetical protein
VEQLILPFLAPKPVQPKSDDFAARLYRCSPDAGKKRLTPFQAEYSKRFNAYGCMK